MNTKRFRKAAVLVTAMGISSLLVSAPAFAWGWAPWNDMPWSGYSNPFFGDSGPFSGYGGPFTGNSGPWSMGNMSFNGPHGGPVHFNSGNWGAYGQPYSGYYGGGYGYENYGEGYGVPYSPAYGYPMSPYGYPSYGNYEHTAPSYYGQAPLPQAYAPPGPYESGHEYP